MKRIKEIEAAMKSKAQEFLNQKARVKHYRISGVFNEEYGDGDTWAIFEYTDEEVEEFREVMLTCKDDEVAGWCRSLQLRFIELPDELKDELFLIIGERRIMH